MNTNILTVAAALSDQDLLARLDLLAARERGASVELVAHLAALDTRPSVFAAKGYSSLFKYCTEALRLSEDAACNRIAAARACGRFPVILDLLGSGDMTLTSVRMLGKHLTVENHEAVLARARRRSRPEIEVLVAELAPQPDVPTSIRRLPVPAVVVAPMPPPNPPAVQAPSESTAVIPPPTTAFVPAPRPIVQPTAPQRYRIQFTIGQETYEELQSLQRLLRREIPDGDPGVIFARAISLLRAKVERTKLGAAARPRPGRVIRPGADNLPRRRTRRSRYMPMAVRRAVSERDGDRCAFVSREGRRCTEREFLQFHHEIPMRWAANPRWTNLLELLAPQPIRGGAVLRATRCFDRRRGSRALRPCPYWTCGDLLCSFCSFLVTVTEPTSPALQRSHPGFTSKARAVLSAYPSPDTMRA